jgi:hypothetical protein
MVLLKASFPEASRAFLSFRSSHDTPTFFAVPYDKIPDPNANFSEMVDLFRLLSSGEQGMIWLEHRRMIPALFSKTLIGRYLNWADALDLSASSVDCELREMKDISVGWHSRYDAIVVSAPRVQDLDDEARPTTKYLKSLFTECSLRWFLRSRTRPMGTKRFRIFDLAMIHVYHRDSRRAELSGSGLTENLLFRAQAGNCGGPPFSGSVWEKIGPYQVTLNRAGHDALKRFRAVSLTRTIGNP